MSNVLNRSISIAIAMNVVFVLWAATLAPTVA